MDASEFLLDDAVVGRTLVFLVVGTVNAIDDDRRHVATRIAADMAAVVNGNRIDDDRAIFIQSALRGIKCRLILVLDRTHTDGRVGQVCIIRL